MRWVGIDEAGYGPNLGPLVIAAVVAEGPDDSPPNLWSDLSQTISRAGGPDDRLWVDDSKAIYRAGKGRERLDQSALATLIAAGHPAPSTFSQWLAAVGAGSLDDVELTPWLEPGIDPTAPWHDRDEAMSLEGRFDGVSWKITSVRAVVVGPSRFNADLNETGLKSNAHFRAFCRLLQPLWVEATTATEVRSDKHGGRHFYLRPLTEAFPNAWIDRGLEGPELSRYLLRNASRRLSLEFCPRADANDGLVALASVTAKAIREAWMDHFNAFWQRQIPGLKPTAGYPTDAKRFRQSIEPHSSARHLALERWWRAR